MKEGMDMRKVMLLAVLFVALFCGYGQCREVVQLNDRIGILTIAQRYNEAIGSDNWEHQISTYFIKSDDSFVPYTTTYCSENMSHVTFICAVNGAGLVTSYAVFVPKFSTGSYMMERIATAMLYSVAPLAYDDVKDEIKRFSSGETNIIRFVADNRRFAIERSEGNNRDYWCVMMAATSLQ
jgi:hypothetical protein